MFTEKWFRHTINVKFKSPNKKFDIKSKDICSDKAPKTYSIIKHAKSIQINIRNAQACGNCSIGALIWNKLQK